ncbi:hypothetical protein [Bradyrhizobium vignae]|uniref:2OG-Fe(II) oxygenase n=1 Tax=Bradyrhizobium vignae TaxID=1549949 RepID=A0A2U3PXQ3_9BRAD|nr:hypothetical protein [Bradyrhizobium vignae]SPP93941.1 protein of unknown function [Bradyrhizobium vignae]
MHVDFQLHSLSGLFARAGSLRDEYASAKPWPHIVINDAFPEKLLDMVAAECTALPEAHLITTNTDRLVKQEISDGLGPATQHLLSLMGSARFREFVSAITGVRELLSDPTHKFAGVHRTPAGGFAKIHRDFEVHSTTTRRVAASGERRVRYWAARPGEDQWIERMSWQDHLRALIPDPLYNVLRAARDRISGAHRSKTS